MVSLFVYYSEEDGYQRQLALLLMAVCGHPKVPTVVMPDLLVVPEEFAYLYYRVNHLYCTRESSFKFPVREPQKLFVGLNIVELFSLQSPDCVKILLWTSLLVNIV